MLAVGIWLGKLHSIEKQNEGRSGHVRRKKPKLPIVVSRSLTPSGRGSIGIGIL